MNAHGAEQRTYAPTISNALTTNAPNTSSLRLNERKPKQTTSTIAGGIWRYDRRKEK